MNRTLIVFCGLLTLVAGCGGCDPVEDDPPPPAIIDPCTNVHDQLWIESMDGTAIAIADDYGEPVRADQSCNAIRWHDGGGFQGGSTFHIEPVIVRPGPPVDYAVYYTLEVEGGGSYEQGVEVYPDQWTYQANDTIAFRTQLFIDADARGKNATLTATVQEIGASAVDIRAGLHISEDYANF